MSFKKTNEAVKVNSGKVGNIRYYVKAGKTYSRSSSSDVSNPRTLSQMAVRCRLANMKAVYNVIAWHLRKCFEGANAATSVYNLFVGRSSYTTPIYLTKEQKIEGYAIAAEYCVSEGSLPPIKYQMSESGILKSSIVVGNAAISGMSIGDLSKLIIENNHSFKAGDSLTFFALKQIDFMGTPYVKLEPAQITLNPNDANPLPATGFDMVVDGCLAADCSEQVGCYGWIHARKDGKKVSTQYLVANDLDLIEQFSSDEALQDAAASYGQVEEDAYIFGGESSRPEGMYLLTVNSENTNKGTVSGGGLYAEGDNATFDAYPKSGYKFAGWYRGSEKFSDDAHVDEFDMPATDVTVVAHFEEDTPADPVTVSLSAGTGGQVQAGGAAAGQTSSVVIDKGDSIVIKAIPSSGHRFVKWSDNDTNATRAISNVQSDLTLSATFEESEEVTCTWSKVSNISTYPGSRLTLLIDGEEVGQGEEEGTFSAPKGVQMVITMPKGDMPSGKDTAICINGSSVIQGSSDDAQLTYSYTPSADFALEISVLGGF